MTNEQKYRQLIDLLRDQKLFDWIKEQIYKMEILYNDDDPKFSIDEIDIERNDEVFIWENHEEDDMFQSCSNDAGAIEWDTIFNIDELIEEQLKIKNKNDREQEILDKIQEIEITRKQIKQCEQFLERIDFDVTISDAEMYKKEELEKLKEQLENE